MVLDNSPRQDRWRHSRRRHGSRQNCSTLHVKKQPTSLPSNKTLSFLCCLFYSGLIERAMVVVPLSTIENWTNELNRWSKIAPKLQVRAYYGSNKAQRAKDLEKAYSKGGVLLTTYGMLLR